MTDIADAGKLTAQSARAELTGFLETRTRQSWAPTSDLFASGAVTSIFAMELVVHIEQTYGITIEGDDLSMKNFRTVDTMVALITRITAGG
ncbi:acyl carrier protein [Amycolatopsis sp. OK19-0408]|uniref:Acyl carrier protein n=1 Tax=Amycolatopsis iheyensis TaxID=2945988 RepID=A0A9X2NLC7_9PSEU|nr:acyl carrier protein [Amycolatopsis iheyensis]MCR6488432.1 acyl carrier protein [Amycolatopsis iheyensis]